MQLHQRKEELDRLGTQVLVISFVENEYWAHAWLEETQSPFPLLLDPDKAAYEAYELESSLFGSWGPRVLWFYLKRALAGRRLRGIQGDPNQLGADFIVDAEGIVRFAYYSEDATDRPAVDELLSVLRRLPVESD